MLSARSFRLAAGGQLRPGDPTRSTPVRVVLLGGQSLSFDLALPAGASLLGRPELAVWTELLGTERKEPKDDRPADDKKAEERKDDLKDDLKDDQAHGHLRVTLADCGPGGCERLAHGDLHLERKGATGAVVTTKELKRLRAVVPPGDVLRLTLELEAKQGVSVAVLHDSVATPSRLVLASEAVTTGGQGLAGLALAVTAALCAHRRRPLRR